MTKILVVDDEPDVELMIRQKFRRHIRARDVEFLFAGDGLEALQRLESDPDVGIILTDINMPRMDGLTLLTRLQKTDHPLKVVIVSAYGDLDNIRTAMNRGAYDFVMKPIDFHDLEVTIEKTRQELHTLREALALQQQFSAIQRELEIASEIQLSTLPSRFPPFPDRVEFDLYATMIPANEVGGDFYDFFLINEHRLGFALGDVSGKGIGAALLMAITRTMLRATAMQDMPAAACVTHVNRVLHPETVARMFVTLVYGVLDTRTGTLEYCNAGHQPPYVVGRDGTARPLPRTRGLGLCLHDSFEYEAGAVVLQPGECLFLYTDGVTEAVDEDHDQFSEERLVNGLREAAGESPTEVIRTILRAVARFSGGRVQADDITMLALQYNGTAP